MCAGGPFAWLPAIELRTSRTSATDDDHTDLVLDDGTGRLFDVLAAIAVIGGLSTSLGLGALTIRPRLVALGVGVVAMVLAATLRTVSRLTVDRVMASWS